MDTNNLKRFASEARNILIAGVSARFAALGFDEQGNAAEIPQLMEGGCVFMGEVRSTDFFRKWKSLQNAIIEHGAKQVAEEAAYTWFNRFVAIRILARNGFIAPVLEFESENVRIPVIVTEARRGRFPEMDATTRIALDEIIDNDALTREQFAVLIVAFCHACPIINKCFGRITDYTELLLPEDIIAPGKFIDLLNSTPFIADDDYRSPELIGWLYQFYISEKKDDVFASFKKGKKAEAEDIPAATQIFTPNWIVKYMVQNTVGRIYLDNNPDSSIREKMKYLVEPENSTPEDKASVLEIEDIHDLTCADLACGSGHILNECFDILFDIYLEEGYSRRKAVEDIFKYNLTGIDLDTRAKQLAQFALLLKACQKDTSFIGAHCMPHVLDMSGSFDEYNWKDTGGHFCCAYQLPCSSKTNDEMIEAFKLMRQAENLGSIMKFDISDESINFLETAIQKHREGHLFDDAFDILVKGFEIILALSKKYAALVMNPPYMGNGNMNAELSQYVKDNYDEGKSDLCTVFMMMEAESVVKGGYYANIVPPSWMFLSTFEGLRRNIIDNNRIASLLHLSRGVFGADFGSVCSVIQNISLENATGTYFRLIERTFQEFDQKHLKLLFEKTLENHDFKYFFADYSKDVTDIVYSEKGAKIYYGKVSQKALQIIPGTPLGYWLSEDMLALFGSHNLSQTYKPRAGLSTTDNDRFLRLWYEISYNKVFFEGKNREDLKFFSRKWVPMTKGGTYRRWYGNNEYLLNFENDGEELKYWLTHNPKDPKTTSYSRYIRNYDYYCLPGISFSDVACGNPHFRWQDEGMIPNSRGPYIYTDNLSVLGFLNGKVAKSFLELLCPTLTFNVGDIGRIPFIDKSNIQIRKYVKESVDISRQDWDAHETSWDFARNELLNMDADVLMENIVYQIEKHFKETGEHICIDPAPPMPESVEWCYEQYQLKWERLFLQLHDNEEELNRQFIDIYGLQDELTPDVPLDEITILQQGEVSIEDNELVWHDDVVMKQLISYAVGCMMGRYSIDKPGLILANQGDGIQQFNELVPASRFDIDEDGIIPLMSEAESSFADNAAHRFKTWLSIAFGQDRLTDNLNFIEACLGKSIDDYFVKDFWKDHKKMYQNRPIYWLFSSKKGAFQCMTYMHRMDAYTPEHVRTKYLLPHIEYLQSRYDDMESRAATLSTKERKLMENIAKQITECREYHDILHDLADQQIAFDLDDGIVVNYAKFDKVLAKLK